MVSQEYRTHAYTYGKWKEEKNWLHHDINQPLIIESFWVCTNHSYMLKHIKMNLSLHVYILMASHLC